MKLLLPLSLTFLSLLLTCSRQSEDIPPNRLFVKDYRLGRALSRLQGTADLTREVNGWERLRDQIPGRRSLIIAEYEQNLIHLIQVPCLTVLDFCAHLLVTRDMDSRHPLQINIMFYSILYMAIGYLHGMTSRDCFEPMSLASGLSKLATLLSLGLILWGTVTVDMGREQDVLEYLEYCDLSNTAAGIVIAALFSCKAICDLMFVSLLEK